MYDFNATIVRCVDGDTVIADVDLGFRTFTRGPFRLLGINAAEHGTKAGDAATAFIRDLLPVGAPVLLQSVKTDKYARWDAILTRPGDTSSVNEQLVASGHAAPWDGQGVKPVPA